MSTAGQREPSPPDRTRYRVLLAGLISLFLLAFLVLRVFGPGSGDDAVPGAGDTTATTFGEGSSTTAHGEPTPAASAGEASTSSTRAETALPALQGVTLDLVLDGFRQPMALAAPPGDDRLFVVERAGVIRLIDAGGVMLDRAFLDLQDQVLAGGIEQGMLGLAFHPDYADNGRLFVYYIDKSGHRQLSEFTVSPSDPNVVLAGSEEVLFEYEQPPNALGSRQYGGNVVFGPDGYLWASMGDGTDSRAQGQDPNTPYGTIVRIDVDSGDPYGIPTDNPFVDGGGLADVWAYGLRNPWRFAIDPIDRLIYIADVGQSDQQEVNVVSIDGGGHNFGWSDMDGTHCFHLPDCDPANYTSPVLTYRHGVPEGEGDAVVGLWITGGYVYRGDEIPEVDGTYFYSDWVGEWIRGFRFVDGEVTDDREWTDELGGEFGMITSYGLDGHGELYITTHEGGIYKFTAIR